MQLLHTVYETATVHLLFARRRTPSIAWMIEHGAIGPIDVDIAVPLKLCIIIVFRSF